MLAIPASVHRPTIPVTQAFVLVGDFNGHIGLGVKCAKEVSPARASSGGSITCGNRKHTQGPWTAQDSKVCQQQQDWVLMQVFWAAAAHR